MELSDVKNKLKIAVLASGSGTNFQAIIDNCATGRINAEIVLLISDNKEAFALTRASQSGIPTEIVTPKNFTDKAEFVEKMICLLKQSGAELVVLAGYMRLVSATLLEAFPNRVINIHPALLPAFPGLSAQAQAVDYGVKISGCTVHFVDAGMDTGPIISQAAVPVFSTDTCETLSERILQEEHKLYSYVIGKIAEGKVRIDDKNSRKVTIEA